MGLKMGARNTYTACRAVVKMSNAPKSVQRVLLLYVDESPQTGGGFLTFFVVDFWQAK